MLQRLRIFFYISIEVRGFIYETMSQNSLQNDVSRLMRDSEIRESADPLRVLQKTGEKQNEELILLTLAVPKTEGVEKRIQLLLQQRKKWM